MTSAPSPSSAPAATPVAQVHCRCGAFRLESTSAPILQLVCHCTQYREGSGRANLSRPAPASG